MCNPQGGLYVNNDPYLTSQDTYESSCYLDVRRYP